HAACEGPGTLGQILKRRGIEPHFIRPYRNDRIPSDILGYSFLIALGGPMGVYEEDIYPFIKKEIALIKTAFKRDVPVLGICFGAQLMAKAAGAAVYKGSAKEIGWYGLRLGDNGLQDRLFIGLPEVMTVFQWHGDTFDVADGARLLASSDLFPNQLLKIGKKAYALQFHLEVTAGMVAWWLDVNDSELKALKGAIDPVKVLSETREKIPSLAKYSEVVFSRFLRLAD
ncbi:MAG: type 1 glutamine amidotransferase, partial [Deltaproteobacteria bacterium]|nr:type 1 glutamine amidotransferase [Deltaproteobacteria bacterium]